MEITMKKKWNKEIWRFFPELFYVCAFALAFIDTVYHTYILSIENLPVIHRILPFIHIAFIVCLVGQYFWRNKILGIILSFILTLGSLYMLLALFSEFQEFSSSDPKRIIFLLAGAAIIGVFGLVAIIMPWKYIRS